MAAGRACRRAIQLTVHDRPTPDGSIRVADLRPLIEEEAAEFRETILAADISGLTLGLGEIDTDYWFDGSALAPTVRKVVEHAKPIAEVDPPQLST